MTKYPATVVMRFPYRGYLSLESNSLLFHVHGKYGWNSFSVPIKEIQKIEISLPKRIWIHSKNQGRIKSKLTGPEIDNYDFWERFNYKLAKINPKLVIGNIGSSINFEGFYFSRIVQLIIAFILVLLFICIYIFFQ